MPELFGGNGVQESCEAGLSAATMHASRTGFPAISPRAIDPVGTSPQVATKIDAGCNGPKDTQPLSAPQHECSLGDIAAKAQA